VEFTDIDYPDADYACPGVSVTAAAPHPATGCGLAAATPTREPTVPEDPIAHSELSALTRRYEETAQKTDREFGIVKSDLTALRLQVGNLDQKVDGLGERLEGLERKIDGFLTEQRSVNTTLVELLSGLVGKGTTTD
jgi:hypothetical protein